MNQAPGRITPEADRGVKVRPDRCCSIGVGQRRANDPPRDQLHHQSMDQEYSPAKPSAPRAHRKWTDEDQSRAEVLREAGFSYRAIGGFLGYSEATIRLYLGPKARKRNSEEYKAYQREYRQRNSEAAKAYQASYCEQNREARLEYCKQNPEKVREHARRRNALKRSSHRVAVNPLTLAGKNAVFAQFDNCCAYCDRTSDLTVGHVLALSRGGLDDVSNIVPACQQCSSSKFDRPVESWYQGKSFFSRERWLKIVEHCPHIAGGEVGNQ